MPPWKESREATLTIFPPVFCFTNCRATAWAKKKDRLQIDVHHVVPVLFGKLDGVRPPDDPRVVDQDIDPAESADGLFDNGFDHADIRQVRFDSQEFPAPLPNLSFRFLQAVDIDPDDIRPRLRETQGHPLPEARSGTGDDGHLPRQLECIQDHADASFPTPISTPTLAHRPCP
jgi:hypothetical protein